MNEAFARRTDPTLMRDLLHAISVAGEHAGAGVIVTFVDSDPPQNIFVTNGAANIMGYSPDELIDRSVWELLEPGEIERLQKLHRQRLEGEPIPESFETVVMRKDGGKTPVEVTTTRLEVGGRLATVTFLFDLTSRRLAEQELRKSEVRFRSVVESAPDGVVILRGADIIYLNDRAALMLGFGSRDGAMGTRITDLLSPEEAQLTRERIGQILQTGHRLGESHEYHSSRRDGKPLVVEISSIPIEYEGAPAVLAFARDVTERKALQERMLQADRLAAVGTLAAGVAHEINNPLAYVLLSLQYVERQLERGDLDAERVGDLLGRITEARHGAERVASIVRDLKAFTRPDDADRGPADVVSAVEGAIKLVDNEIRHRARLIRRYGKTAPVAGSAARLEQVFVNLLVNAAHALSDREGSGGEISIAVGTSEDGNVIATVADNGPGIPPDVRPSIFEPFFTTKPVGVGTGLGLPICHMIVTTFGGNIDVSCPDGGGTTVTVTLRPYEGAPRSGSQQAAPRSSRSASRRGLVLIVDDEPLVAQLLARNLERHHDVVLATSGPDALQAIEEEPLIDAVLCDLMMPGMTGAEVYAAIRDRHPQLESRVLFMTGGAFLPQLADFVRQSERPVLDKPLDIPELLERLRAIVDQPALAARAASDTPHDAS